MMAEKKTQDAPSEIDRAPIGGDAKADEVPTARKVDGHWQTGKMPSSEAVIEFIDRLTTQYPIRVDVQPFNQLTTDEFNKWFDAFRPEHAPISDWAVPLDNNEEALLEHACKALSWSAFGTLVAELKAQGVYPAEWGIGAGFQRSTTERLFDRLRLNHIYYAGQVKRWPFWWSHPRNAEQGIQTTIFGRRHSQNAFYLLREKLSTGGNALGSIVGLTDAPHTFAMPLEWIEAAESGLSPEIRSTLPADTQAGLRDFAHDLDNGIHDVANTSFIVGLIAGIGAALVGGPVLGGLLVVLGAEAKKLAKSLDSWPDELRAAGAADERLNDAGVHLLRMLRTTDFKGLFSNKIEDALNLDEKVFLVDLPHDTVEDVERALVTLPTVPFQPMVLLGDQFAEYAKQFGRTPFMHGGSNIPVVTSAERLAAGLWTTWWNDSKPSLDAAFVIDTASLILEQLMYLDDSLLALNDLVVGDGIVAVIVRRALDEKGLTRYVDALGGASPVASLRYLFRQLLTDLFMELMHEKEDVAESDLHPIFCWMNSSAKRKAIDDALGPKIEATAENAGDMWAPILAIKGSIGFQLGDSISIRGAFLQNVSDEEKGALGRPISVFTEYPSDPERAAAAISDSELGYLRGWLALARKDCLAGLHDALEPDWDAPPAPPSTGTPHGPDRDDIPVLDSGTRGPLGPTV
jgi:hypothetical protein